MNFHDRRFLNGDDGTAAMELIVQDESTFITATVKLTDCSRQIDLDFDIYYHGESGTAIDKVYRERIRKFDRLIDGLTAMKAVFQKCHKGHVK